MANRYTLVIQQGTTVIVPVRWYTDASKTTLKDLSGYSANMQFRENYGDEDPILSIDDEGGIVLSDGSGTENIEITLSAEITEALPAPFSGVFDLELIDSGGIVSKPLYGDVEIIPEATK